MLAGPVTDARDKHGLTETRLACGAGQPLQDDLGDPRHLLWIEIRDIDPLDRRLRRPAATRGGLSIGFDGFLTGGSRSLGHFFYHWGTLRGFCDDKRLGLAALPRR